MNISTSVGVVDPGTRSKIVMPLLVVSAMARSSPPSPFTSPTERPVGLSPVLPKPSLSWKVPSPFPSRTDVALAPPSEVTRSGFPSPSRSTTATALGRRPAVQSTGGAERTSAQAQVHGDGSGIRDEAVADEGHQVREPVAVQVGEGDDGRDPGPGNRCGGWREGEGPVSEGQPGLDKVGGGDEVEVSVAVHVTEADRERYRADRDRVGPRERSVAVSTKDLDVPGAGRDRRVGAPVSVDVADHHVFGGIEHGGSQSRSEGGATGAEARRDHVSGTVGNHQIRTAIPVEVRDTNQPGAGPHRVVDDAARTCRSRCSGIPIRCRRG